MTQLDRILAGRTNEYFASGIDGLTALDCDDLTQDSLEGNYESFIDDHMCSELQAVMGKGSLGEITAKEEQRLFDSGFSCDFIKGLAGSDGKRAMRVRSMWLGSFLHRRTEIPRQTMMDVLRELKAMGEAARDAAPLFAHELYNYDCRIHYLVSGALKAIDPDPVETLPVIMKSMREHTRMYDWKSTVAIARSMGEEGRRSLLAMLWSDDQLSEDASYLISKMGPDFKDDLTALSITLVTSQQSYVRSNIVKAMGEMGPDAAAALPALMRLLAVEKLGSQHWGAINAIGAIGPSAKPAVPILVRILETRDKYLMVRTAGALGNIGPGAYKAVPALLEIVKDPQAKVDVQGYSAEEDRENIRSAAVLALGRIGPASEPALPTIVSLLKHEDSHMRSTAADAIGGIGAPAIHEIPNLMRLLGDPDIEVRISALRALGEMGSAADAAVPMLARCARSHDEGERAAAEEALERIGGIS